MLTATHLPSSPSALSAPTRFFFPLSLSLRLPLSRSLQVAVHNDGPVFPPVCQPFTCILATTSLLWLGAPCGASKQDAGGMKNKHSCLSSSLHPFSHSFTRKDEAILRWSWELNALPESVLSSRTNKTLYNSYKQTFYVQKCTQLHSMSCIYVCLSPLAPF